MIVQKLRMRQDQQPMMSMDLSSSDCHSDTIMPQDPSDKTFVTGLQIFIHIIKQDVRESEMVL